MYFVCTEDLASVQAGCVSFASPYMKDLSGVVPQTKCFLECATIYRSPLFHFISSWMCSRKGTLSFYWRRGFLKVFGNVWIGYLTLGRDLPLHFRFPIVCIVWVRGFYIRCNILREFSPKTSAWYVLKLTWTAQQHFLFLWLWVNCQSVDQKCWPVVRSARPTRYPLDPKKR